MRKWTGVLMSFGVFLFSLFPCYGQEQYQQGDYRLVRSHYDHALVEGFDVDRMMQSFCPGFHKYFQLSNRYYGLLYNYVHNIDKQAVNIRIGIYPTVQVAEESALDFLNSMDGHFLDGSPQNKLIGDNCWRYEVQVGAETSRLHIIAFVRKNVFITASMDYSVNHSERLIDLSASIDSVITNGAPFLSFSDSPLPPVISAIQLSKSILHEGESSIIDITAKDPRGKNLQYQKDFPGNETSEKSTFVIEYSKSKIPLEYWGTTQTFFVWVVNDDNLFSLKEEIQLTF